MYVCMYMYVHMCVCEYLWMKPLTSNALCERCRCACSHPVEEYLWMKPLTSNALWERCRCACSHPVEDPPRLEDLAVILHIFFA